MKLEEYEGQTKEETGLYGLQSQDLIIDYVHSLTNNEMHIHGNAKDTVFANKFPKGWKIKKYPNEFIRGSIFVYTRSSYGFTGIILEDYDELNVRVVSQNYRGGGNLPCEIHLYPKKDIDFLITPDKESFIKCFK